MLRGFVVGQIVEQNRTQNGALGFNIRREGVSGTVISGCQGYLFVRAMYLKT
jgi:hypothetical protein